jgi:hypothetical protein
LLHEPRLASRSDDGRGIQGPARSIRQPRQPREDGVANGRGHGHCAGRQDLVDEKRIAGGASMEFRRIQPASRRERGYSVRRKRLNAQAAHAVGSRKVAQNHAQRVPWANLIVPISGDQ